jgi:hypothetical protein
MFKLCNENTIILFLRTINFIHKSLSSTSYHFYATQNTFILPTIVHVHIDPLLSKLKTHGNIKNTTKFMISIRSPLNHII